MRMEGTVLCVCVCLCATTKLLIISKSKQATSLELDNLRQKVVLYMTGKFLQAHIHVAQVVVSKFENKKN